MLRIRDVTARLNISKPTCYRLIAAGRSPAVRLTDHGALRVPEAELERWLESRRTNVEAA